MGRASLAHAKGPHSENWCGMRVTFVLPYAGLAGGIRVVAIYAQRLHARGHTVQVVSVPQRSIPLRERVKSLVMGRGWLQSPQPGPGHFDGLNVPHKVLETCRPVVDTDVPDADVVVATWWETAEWVARLSPSKGAKAYFIQHDERVMMWDSYRVRAAATWRLPMHKITIARWLVDTARRDFMDEQVSLVPNSVDTAQFFAPIRGKQRRPTVGVLYSPVPIKGWDVSTRAVAAARRRLPDIQVIAYGATEPDETAPLPPSTCFHLRPEQHVLREIYASCDVWLCGSRSEGFHLPPLEAMACRCPVVSTRVGGAVETVQEGKNGFLTDVEADEALADRLERVLRLPEEQWKGMSDAAFATAKRYTWDDAALLLEQALMRAIERLGRGELVA